MHCTPQAKANVNLPAHQPPMNDNNYLLGDDNDVLVDPEQQDPPNLENFSKEEVTYYPLINGKLAHFHSQKKLTVI